MQMTTRGQMISSLQRTFHSQFLGLCWKWGPGFLFICFPSEARAKHLTFFWVKLRCFLQRSSMKCWLRAADILANRGKTLVSLCSYPEKRTERSRTTSYFLSRFVKRHIHVACMYLLRSHSNMVMLSGVSPRVPGLPANTVSSHGQLGQPLPSQPGYVPRHTWWAVRWVVRASGMGIYLVAKFPGALWRLWSQTWGSVGAIS